MIEMGRELQDSIHYQAHSHVVSVFVFVSLSNLMGIILRERERESEVALCDGLFRKDVFPMKK